MNGTVEIRKVRVPFRFQYGHAAKQHHGVQAVIVGLNRDGKTGLGEAVPRRYVTGESVDSVFAGVQKQVDASREVLRNLSWEDYSNWRQHSVGEQSGPYPSCAACALDLAVADWCARQSGRPLYEQLGGQRISGDSHVGGYCASIGFGKGWRGAAKLKLLLWLYRRLGFRRFKIKVGGEQDEQRLQAVRRQLGNDVEIFADANAAWNREDAIRKIEMLARYDIWAVEEPLAFRATKQHVQESEMQDRLSLVDEDRLRDMRWLRERSPMPLIADESLICLTSMQRLLDAQACDLFNVRLSKCGGPIISAKMVKSAHEAGLDYSVAAMVGESPILAVSGAHFALASQALGQSARYVQGFSHGLLHRVRFVSGAPAIRKAGVVLSAAPGNGLHLMQRHLDVITEEKCQIQL